MKNIKWKKLASIADECLDAGFYTYVGAHPSGDGHFVYNEEQGIAYIHNDYLEKPQDEIPTFKDENNKEIISKWHRAFIKIKGLGYEYHNGEWLSKEEIEKQEKINNMTSVLWGSDLGIGSFDAKSLAEKLVNIGVEYRKGEL